MSEKYRSVREWEVELPERMSPDWLELVAILFDRQDISDDFWPTELIVAGLIGEGELSGGTDYPGYKYLDKETGEVKTKVLAKVRMVPAKRETVYDPAHWAWSLEPTERELEYNVELSAAAALERIQGIADPDEREDTLRHVVGVLTDHLADRYGS
ncbi:MAG TPA: hypothetical protein VGR71_16735 [Nitrospira sp.]|nr:hypothetical protein [Nitrospira sp.]